MRPDSITLAIFEKYTPEELADTATKLVQALADQETAETEKKTSDAVFKERIGKHATEANELAHKYSKGGESAQIGCTIRYDMPAPGKKSYIRMDTEAVVEVHDMSLEERQETLQFPLATAPTEEAKPEKKKKSKPEEPPAPAEEHKTVELTFKDIQSIAATIAKLPAEHRPASILEMQAKIATTLRIQKGVIGPDGMVETIDSQTKADAFAEAWLKLALEKELAPPPEQEVTRLCPYPGCILFIDHEGNHEFQKVETEAPPIEAEPQRQPEKKTTRKKRGYAPPEPPCQEPPQPPAGD
jgi:hypothetical protein